MVQKIIIPFFLAQKSLFSCEKCKNGRQELLLVRKIELVLHVTTLECVGCKLECIKLNF